MTLETAAFPRTVLRSQKNKGEKEDVKSYAEFLSLPKARPEEYKNELKLTKAKKLLVTTDDSITDIAYACGFSSASYFAERFSKSEGMLPLQYRNLNRK